MPHNCDMLSFGFEVRCWAMVRVGGAVVLSVWELNIQPKTMVLNFPLREAKQTT